MATINQVYNGFSETRGAQMIDMPVMWFFTLLKLLSF